MSCFNIYDGWKLIKEVKKQDKDFIIHNQENFYKDRKNDFFPFLKQDLADYLKQYYSTLRLRALHILYKMDYPFLPDLWEYGFWNICKCKKDKVILVLDWYISLMQTKKYKNLHGKDSKFYSAEERKNIKIKNIKDAPKGGWLIVE